VFGPSNAAFAAIPPPLLNWLTNSRTQNSAALLATLGVTIVANVPSPQWTEDQVEVGAGDAFLERFIGTSTWASREFLTALIGPNRR
jgi:hypothetical protein